MKRSRISAAIKNGKSNMDVEICNWRTYRLTISKRFFFCDDGQQWEKLRFPIEFGSIACYLIRLLPAPILWHFFHFRLFSGKNALLSLPASFSLELFGFFNPLSLPSSSFRRLLRICGIMASLHYDCFMREAYAPKRHHCSVCICRWYQP